MQKTGQEVGAVLRILDKMQSTPSERVFQIVAFVIQRFLGLIFSLGVHIAEDDVQRLRDAEATGNPIVLLPTHRSHVDYCVTSLFLYVNGLRMPYVVAGENLNQPVLGKVLRSCGAFFIKKLRRRRLVRHGVQRLRSCASPAQNYRGVLRRGWQDADREAAPTQSRFPSD